MSNSKLEVPRLRDSVLFQFVQQIAEIVQATQINVHEIGAARSEAIATLEIKNHPLATSQLFTIRSFSVGSPGYNLSLTRGADDVGDYAFDRLTIDNNSIQANNAPRIEGELARKISALISETFMASPDLISPLFHSGRSFEALMKSHQRMIEKLQESITNIGEQAVGVRLRLEEEYAARNATLNEEFEKRQTELGITSEEAKRILVGREEELEARRKQLDDRDNTHARRDLHKTLKARIAERGGKFEITPETRSTRTPIHVGSLLSMALLAALLFYYSTSLSDIVSNAPTSVLLAAAISLLASQSRF